MGRGPIVFSKRRGTSEAEVAALIAAANPNLWDPWFSGYRYDGSSFEGGENNGVQAIVANTLYAHKIVPISAAGPGSAISLNAIDARLNVAAAAGKKCRIALYTYGTSGKPDETCALIAQSVELAEDAGANTTVNDGAFAATVYSHRPIWACFWGDGAPTMITIVRKGNRAGISTATQAGVYYPGWAVTGQTYTAGSSSFPGTFPTGAVPSNVAVSVSVKVA